MKKIFSLMVLGLIIITSPKPAHAQMGAAATIQWDVTKKASIKAEQEAVWSLLSDLKEITLYSKDFIKSAVIKGSSMPFDRVLTFANGTTRVEQIDQIEQEHKFIAYRFTQESLPKGIESAEIAVFTKASGKTTDVEWLARIEGNAEAKKALIAQLTAEFEVYATGMTNLFKNTIPATPMN
ncbi:SRPBCC family protein [Solitalea sp. MAHUQ-68]|uniref:SRPBCC family protein n=1 Tax=Solitalea agri TaxID=2953739 RepID=A0A9X2F2D8_9SPHI|nr:SRPBCC family protein [Solitalea agri]MCO4292849.1 SRPBCC family protein [Solitalea agri]